MLSKRAEQTTYGLIHNDDDDGNLRARVIEECNKIANVQAQ
jgi:hypothetical protein